MTVARVLLDQGASLDARCASSIHSNIKIEMFEAKKMETTGQSGETLRLTMLLGMGLSVCSSE